MNKDLMVAALMDADIKSTFASSEVSAMRDKTAFTMMAIKSHLRQLRSGIEGVDDERGKELDGLFDKIFGRLSNLEDYLTENETVHRIDAVQDAVTCVLGELRRAPPDLHALSNPSIRQQVLDLTGGKCAYCGTDLKDGGGGQDQFCIEHVVPVSKGGPNNIVNYVPACRSCNSAKGDRHALYFIQNSYVMRSRAPVSVSPVPEAAE